MNPLIQQAILGGGPATLPPGAVALFDATRTDLLFTSNAASGAISDGASVGYWGDASGNGFDVSSAADDTTRPVWTFNNGFPYVAFDGTNDVLFRTAALDLYSANECTVGVAMTPTSMATDDAIFGEAQTGSANDRYALIRSSSTTAANQAVFIRNNAGTVILNNDAVTVDLYSTANTTKTFIITDYAGTSSAGGSQITPYWNGVKQNMSNNYFKTGTFTFNRTSVGGHVGTTTANFGGARIFALVAYKRLLPSGQISQLHRWLARRAGI